VGKLPPRCMWPIDPGSMRVPASGRKHMMTTIRICSRPARWRIVRGDERTYVCDRCKPAALKTYDGEATVEELPPPDEPAGQALDQT